MSEHAFSRRRLLKGLGATVALPFMHSLYPSSVFASTPTKRPQRFACLFMPNGAYPPAWTPTGTGSDFEFSEILSPLSGVKDKVLVLSGLMNKNSISRFDGHYTKTANFLTSMPITRTVDAKVNAGGTSVDQIMAQHIGNETLFPSLQYGIDRIRSGVDLAVGFTRLYGGTISWATPSTPCPREIEPRFAFDRMFRNHIPGKKPLPPDPYKKSVLDLVKADTKVLERRLGIEDQNKLGEYLEAVRSVEKRINQPANLEDFAARITPDVRKELQKMDLRIDEWAEYSEGVDITKKVRLMIDIMVLAFWSDASRVATFMFGNSVSSRNFSFLDGVSDSHHSVSHHNRDPRMLSQYQLISKWHIEQYNYMLERLDAIPDGDGTLLDSSMVLFGSGLSDGDRHSPYDLPIVLGGRGGNKFKTGQHVQYESKTPLAGLYQTMLHAMDLPSQQFADGEGPFCELLV